MISYTRKGNPRILNTRTGVDVLDTSKLIYSVYKPEPEPEPEHKSTRWYIPKMLRNSG